MQEWHFKIYGQVIIENDDAKYYIHPENVKSVVRISDFLNENMPKILLNLAIDKNLYDIIITNAKTATILLQIDKFVKPEEDSNEERQFEEYIKDEFSIFVSDDINYNKDVDYKPEAEELEGKREDVYRQCSIGLISKSCIETNKNFANNVFYKTDMVNMVCFYLQGTHLLMEPLKYNKEMEQLAIPPQETLVKTIEFLNNIKVFYDTKYLFFIDEPYCTYLISRSGKGIEKKDDVYLDVCFNVHGKNDTNAMTPGMGEDTKEKRFYVDINVVDTRFSIDHDTAKIYTKIEEIINPDIKNTVSTLDSIQSLTGMIQSTINDFKNIGHQIQGTMEEFQPSKLKREVQGSIKDWLNNVVPEIDSKSFDFTNLVNTIPEIISVISTKTTPSPSGGVMTTTTTINHNLYSSGEKASSNSITDMHRNNMTNNYAQVQKLEEPFSTLTDTSQKVGYDISKSDNHIGGCDPVNTQYGVKNTTTGIYQISEDAQKLQHDEETLIQPNKHFVADTKSSYEGTVNNMNSTINILSQRIDNIESSMGPGDSSPDLEQAKEILQSMIKIYDKVTENKGEVGSSNENRHNGLGYQILHNLDNIMNMIDTFQKNPPSMNSLGDNLKGSIPSLTNILQSNLTGKIMNIFSSLENIGQTAEKALDKIRNIGKLGENISFDFSDIIKAKDSLDSILDLTGVGKLGLSSFETKLEIGGCFGGAKEGIKVLRTINDNSNKVKNVKAEMENMVNQLSLNKFDVDPSVFTPNKRYTIYNYDGHNDKNGIFLLNKKTEIFFREDDTFVGNVMLDFCKLADQANEGDEGSSAAHSTQDPVNKTSRTKEDEIAKNNTGLRDSSKSNTSDALFDPGNKVNSNTNGNQKIMDDIMRYSEQHGIGYRIDGGLKRDNVTLGRGSITDFMSGIGRR